MQLEEIRFCCCCCHDWIENISQEHICKENQTTKQISRATNDRFDQMLPKNSEIHVYFGLKGYFIVVPFGLNAPTVTKPWTEHSNLNQINCRIHILSFNFSILQTSKIETGQPSTSIYYLSQEMKLWWNPVTRTVTSLKTRSYTLV